MHLWVVAAASGAAVAILHAARVHELYLELAGRGSWGAAAAVAGVAGGALLGRARRHRSAETAPLFLASSLAVVLSCVVPFWAFGRAFAPAAACVFAVVFATTAAVVHAFSGLNRWSWHLGLLPWALNPLRAVVLVVLLMAAITLSAHFGHHRGGLAIAAWLAVIAAFHPIESARLDGRRVQRSEAVFAIMAATFACTAIATIALVGRVLPLHELDLYADEIVYAANGASHRYVVVAAPPGYELFEDAVLVASPLDGANAARALVAPAGVPRRSALLLFGGAGLVEHALTGGALTVVVADPGLPAVAARVPWLAETRRAATSHVAFAEPLPWLRDHGDVYDVIVANLPPPADYRAGKYYTRYFFELLSRHLTDGGTAVVPATSAFASPGVFESVAATAEAAGFDVTPYHVPLPALGIASYVVLRHRGHSPVLPSNDADDGKDLALRHSGRVILLHDQHVVPAFAPRDEPVSER